MDCYMAINELCHVKLIKVLNNNLKVYKTVLLSPLT